MPGPTVEMCSRKPVSLKGSKIPVSVVCRPTVQNNFQEARKFCLKLSSAGTELLNKLPMTLYGFKFRSKRTLYLATSERQQVYSILSLCFAYILPVF